MDNKKPQQSARNCDRRFVIETEQESDGRWIAEIGDIPGVLAYGESEEQAKANAYALALRVGASSSNRVPPQVAP